MTLNQVLRESLEMRSVESVGNPRMQSEVSANQLQVDICSSADIFSVMTRKCIYGTPHSTSIDGRFQAKNLVSKLSRITFPFLLLFWYDSGPSLEEGRPVLQVL